MFLFLLGLLSGVILGILNFILLEKSLKKGRFSYRKERFYHFFVKFPLRYGIMAVLLWLAVTKDLGFFIGMIAGMLLLKLAAYIDILPTGGESHGDGTG
jgi:hypothetical protein